MGDQAFTLTWWGSTKLPHFSRHGSNVRNVEKCKEHEGEAFCAARSNRQLTDWSHSTKLCHRARVLVPQRRCRCCRALPYGLISSNILGYSDHVSSQVRMMQQEVFKLLDSLSSCKRQLAGVRSQLRLRDIEVLMLKASLKHLNCRLASDQRLPATSSCEFV